MSSCCTPDPDQTPAEATDSPTCPTSCAETNHPGAEHPMCSAEYSDDDHDLGCELPAGHDGPHLDDGVAFEDKPPRYPSLPLDLTEGLTIWGGWGGAQMRIEHDLCPHDPCPTGTDGHHTHDHLAHGALYLAHRDDAPRSPEDGQPWQLTAAEARALRDLLNVATARGVL